MFYINSLDFCKFQKNQKVLTVDIRDSNKHQENEKQIKKHNDALFEFLSTNTVIDELYFYFNVECCFNGDCAGHFNINEKLFANIKFPPNLSTLSLCRIHNEEEYDDKKVMIRLPEKLKTIFVYNLYSFGNIEYNNDIEHIIVADSDDEYFLDDAFSRDFSHLHKLESVQFYNCKDKRLKTFMKEYIELFKLPYGCTTEIISKEHPLYSNDVLYTRNE